MLVNATFVPDSALLVPGVAGSTEVLTDTRAAAVQAARTLVTDGPTRVVVVACGRADRTWPGPHLPTLAAAGVDDAVLRWTMPGAGAPPDRTPVDGPAASTALLLLAHAGWRGPVTVAEVAPRGRPWEPTAGRAADLAARGCELVAGRDGVGMLVTGSLSARRGPDAPLAEDERAPAVDDAALADLADAGPDARARLAAVPEGLAAELVMTAWAPWQVALGAVPAGSAIRSTVHHAAAPFGVTYVVASWRTVATADMTTDTRTGGPDA